MPSVYHKKPKAAPDNHPVFFDGMAGLPDGWEMLLSDDDAKRRYRFTAERIRKNKEKFAFIVGLLALGVPANVIAETVKCSRNIIPLIQEQEKISIEQLKKENASLMLKGARLCIRSFLQDLALGIVDPKTKAIAAGIFSQNGLVFAGEPSAIIATEDRRGIDVAAIKALVDALPRVKADLVIDVASDAESVGKDANGQ